MSWKVHGSHKKAGVEGWTTVTVGRSSRPPKTFRFGGFEAWLPDIATSRLGYE